MGSPSKVFHQLDSIIVCRLLSLYYRDIFHVQGFLYKGRMEESYIVMVSFCAFSNVTFSAFALISIFLNCSILSAHSNSLRRIGVVGISLIGWSIYWLNEYSCVFVLQLALLSDSSHVFYSCGEDAVVFQVDLRQEKPNKFVTFLVVFHPHTQRLFLGQLQWADNRMCPGKGVYQLHSTMLS